MRWLMTWNLTSKKAKLFSALDIELRECVVRFNLNSSISRREKLPLLFIANGRQRSSGLPSPFLFSTPSDFVSYSFEPAFS